MFFVVLCPGTPEGSTSSDSGFKVSQKTGQRLKVLGLKSHLTDREKLGIKPATPGLQDKKLFVAFPWVVTSTGPGGFMVCVFII